MKSFKESLVDWQQIEDGSYKIEFGDGYELWFEKLIFDEQYYIALYKNQELITDKIVIKPGK